MIKAAFFDIDGTLMDHSIGQIPSDTKEALAELRRSGVKIFTSTGRHLLELQELGVTELSFDGHVLLNGQICLDKEEQLIDACAIPEEDMQGALRWFDEMELPVAFVEQKQIYINFINDRVRKTQADISSELPKTGRFDGNPVYLVNVFADEADVNRVLADMPHCRMTRWNPYGVDIIAAGNSKAKGMERVLRYYGIDQEEIIAFGDGENDMEMLQFAGIGVAMGNADPEVKEIADYVTDSVGEGGITHALQHFKLI